MIWRRPFHSVSTHSAHLHPLADHFVLLSHTCIHHTPLAHLHPPAETCFVQEPSSCMHSKWRFAATIVWPGSTWEEKDKTTIISTREYVHSIVRPSIHPSVFWAKLLTIFLVATEHFYGDTGVFNNIQCISNVMLVYTIIFSITGIIIPCPRVQDCRSPIWWSH